ncbi:MAG: succinate dehydrogenase assembly factor 2 [Mariprofundaceae bacterium]
MPSPAALQQDVRRLRYRLKRQGMLELDEWLSPLEMVLEAAQPETVAAIAGLLDQEPADLLEVMRGRRMPPACLQDALAMASASMGSDGGVSEKGYH